MLENMIMEPVTAGSSTFVEIPLTGKDGGEESSFQITGFQISARQERRPAQEVVRDTEQSHAEIMVQLGDTNLLIYEGIHEDTLRTVMKVVMGHA